MPDMPPATKAIVLTCVALFCLNFFMPLDMWFSLWPLSSSHFRPWQLVTYSVLHGDTWHLFFNMLGLWMFGSEIERIWGQKRFVHFLLASLLAAAVAQLLVGVITRSPVPTVGASGALYGLLLAFAMMFPNRTVMPLFPPIPMKARTFVVVFGVIELGFGLLGSTGIAHFAHLGGMLGGWLMISYWRGRGPFGRR
jgi:membrane associated rhomboid family serine protease